MGKFDSDTMHCVPPNMSVSLSVTFSQLSTNKKIKNKKIKNKSDRPTLLPDPLRYRKRTYIFLVVTKIGKCEICIFCEIKKRVQNPPCPLNHGRVHF